MILGVVVGGLSDFLKDILNLAQVVFQDNNNKKKHLMFPYANDIKI